MADNTYFHLIILLAGFTQGFTGFGSALIMLPLLTLMTGVKTVVPLVILLGGCVNVILFFQVRRHVQWKRIHVLLMACVPGIFCGVYILKTMPTGFLELVIGLVLVVFPAWVISRGAPVREVPSWWAWPAGFLSGVLGGSISTGGPPVIIYTALQPWGKLAIKSTLVGFFLFTSAAAGVVQAAGGLMTRDVLVLFAAGLPALITGVLGGSYLFGKVDSSAYRKMLSILLILLGVVMLGRAGFG
jgi:uncharacterized membrane protein YfcA